MNNKYQDIINLPHYEPKKHPRMSIESRSAQFAPFAALTGYDDAVVETGRITQSRIELDEEQKLNISNKLQYVLNNNFSEVTITYFVHDKRKSGGKYINKTGYIKKIDLTKQQIIFTDKTGIPIEEVIDIKSELFKNIEQ